MEEAQKQDEPKELSEQGVEQGRDEYSYKGEGRWEGNGKETEILTV